jgi:hypothetical protein
MINVQMKILISTVYHHIILNEVTMYTMFLEDDINKRSNLSFVNFLVLKKAVDINL